MKEFGTQCRDVRTREVGIQEIHQKVQPYQVMNRLKNDEIDGSESKTIICQVELIRRDYTANGGWETFLSYEDPDQDI